MTRPGAAKRALDAAKERGTQGSFFPATWYAPEPRRWVSVCYLCNVMRTHPAVWTAKHWALHHECGVSMV